MNLEYKNKNIVFTQIIPQPAEQLIKKAGWSYNTLATAGKGSEKRTLKLLNQADALISLLSDKIDRDFIDLMPSCKVIANYAVGYNNIDTTYAREKGIVVTNTPDVLTEATAELAFALILSVARNIVPGEKLVRAGGFKGWKPDLLRGLEMAGRTIGIVGAGRIGSAVAVRARAFGMKILYYNRSRNMELESVTGAKKVTIERLMKDSDIISVHLPLNTLTKGLIDRSLLECMKPDAVFINTARGEVIDEKHLIRMLQKKRIFGAGFDVYENEPQLNPELFTLDNAVLCPHLGSATFEARARMAEIAAKNVIAVLKGKKALTPVN